MQNGCYLITGGSSGTGKEASRLLKEQGYKTIIWGTNEEKLKKAVEESAADSYNIVDVSDPQAVSDGFKAILSENELLGVVHAAGIWEDGKLADLDPNTITRLINIVTYGSVWVTKEAVKAFLGKTGKIVLIAAASAKPGFHDTALNTLAKRAVDGLQEALSIEIIDQDIKLTTIYPDSIGPADSENVKNGHTMSYQDVASVIIFALNASPTMQVREIILTAAKTSR